LRRSGEAAHFLFPFFASLRAGARPYQYLRRGINSKDWLKHGQLVLNYRVDEFGIHEDLETLAQQIAELEETAPQGK
jgi:hypothetical protein